MRSNIFRGFLASSCLLSGSLCFAAVTVNGSGSYATITEALNNAADGAVLEITDSAIYNENVHVTLNNITIRAAAGQTPTIAGVAAPHPVAASSMPVKWHGGGQDTTFNANGAAVINSGTGLTLQGLTLDAGAASGALDLRFGTATVENSVVNAVGKVAGILSLGDQTLTGLTVTGATDSIITQGTGTLTLANSIVNGGSRAASFLGGTINASNSQLIDNDTTVNPSGIALSANGVIIGNAFGDITTNFDHVVFRSGATVGTRRVRVLFVIDNTGTAGQNFPGGQWGPGKMNFTANNSDFIGYTDPSLVAYLDNHAISVNTGRVGWVLENLTITNSNFHGQTLSPVNMGGSINEPNAPYGIRPDEITITNNYFYKTYNNIEDQCDVLGNYGWCARNDESNIQSFGPWDPLYVDAENGNFQIASDSPAATAASDGGPTGALGVGGTAVENYTEHTVAKTGTANFSTIQAAYDAAVDGDVITILDSSTYNENLHFAAAKKTIYLHSDEALAARPVVSGTNNAIMPWTIRLAGDSQRVTIQGINFLGTDLPAGSRAFRFEDGGQSIVADCNFETGGSVDWCLYMSPTRGRVFVNGDVLHQTPGFGAVIEGGFGNTIKFDDYNVTSTVSGAQFFVMNIANLTLDIDNLQMSAVGGTFEQRFGALDIRHSHIRSGAHRNIWMRDLANTTLRLYWSILESSGKQGAVPEQWGIASESGAAGDAKVIVDNSDIFGGPDGTVGVWMRNDGDRAVIKDSIISNFVAFAFHEDAPNEFPAEIYTNWAATIGSMDYNVLINSPDPNGVAGPNSVVAPSLESVYINAPADFRLTGDSVALGVNSSVTAPYAGATPSWAGSQGPGEPLANVGDWALYQ